MDKENGKTCWEDIMKYGTKYEIIFLKEDNEESEMIEEKKIPPMIKRLIKKKKFKGQKSEYKEHLDKLARGDEKEILEEETGLPEDIEKYATPEEMEFLLEGVGDDLIELKYALTWVLNNTPNKQKVLDIFTQTYKELGREKGINTQDLVNKVNRLKPTLVSRKIIETDPQLASGVANKLRALRKTEHPQV